MPLTYEQSTVCEYQLSKRVSTLVFPGIVTLISASPLSEHVVYSQREHGPLHAEPMQHQDLVSSPTASTAPPHPGEVSSRPSFCNALSSRFVIELCEPIQVKQLDIANFELFSSTPKDFLVSISDRYV